MTALKQTWFGVTLNSGIAESSSNAGCHCVDASQALIAELKLISFGATCAASMSQKVYSALCH